MFFVEVAQIPADFLFGLGNCFVRAPIDFFLLEIAPEALHVRVVHPTALAVYKDAYAVRLICLFE